MHNDPVYLYLKCHDLTQFGNVRSLNEYTQDISEADTTAYRTASMPSYNHSICFIKGIYVFQFRAILLGTNTHTHTHTHTRQENCMLYQKSASVTFKLRSYNEQKVIYIYIYIYKMHIAIIYAILLDTDTNTHTHTTGELLVVSKKCICDF